MRGTTAALLLVTIATAADCPFGYPPENACPTSAPSCALFSDADGDGLCDNPGPQPVIEDPVDPDTAAVIPEIVPEDTVTVSPPPDTLPETVEPIQDPVEEPVDTMPADSASVPADSTGSDSTCVVISCPLGYTPEQACPADAPSCALFRDDSGDGFCDNPGPRTGEVAVAGSDSTAAPLPVESDGCPRGLPPAAACPYERQLCPHWFGRWTDDTCANPSAGIRRAGIVLGTMTILLGIATVLSRRMRGGRRIRRRARAARLVVLAASLLVLGFLVQGCFCPLGTFQYAFGASGLAFLGAVGILILVVPIVHALFLGRVYCGWVCPMGALQEILWKLDILRLPQPGRRLDRFLLTARAVVFLLFAAALVLAWRGVLDVSWPALFCSVDPFHAVFSLFLAGNLVLGLVIVVVSIFWGRLFCRYLCFYGFVLGLACRAGLWTRICRIAGRNSGSCEPDDKDGGQGSCEVGTE